MAEIKTEDRTDPEGLIKRALNVAFVYGGYDSAHHKAWVIDQMVRCLTASPHEDLMLRDSRGYAYQARVIGKSAEYEKFVADHNAGEDGPDTYSWDVGIPP